jgi:hypothetical protein
MLHRSFLWHYIQSLLLGETKVSSCNVLYLMMCGMFSLQGGLETVHMFQSLMFFLLLHSKTKNDFTLKNSWEWKDNQCLYWMKLPNPGSVAPQPCSHNGFGNTRITIGATVTSSIHHILWCCRQRLPLKLEITLEQPLFMPSCFTTHSTFWISQNCNRQLCVVCTEDCWILMLNLLHNVSMFFRQHKWQHLRRLHWSLF